ncbi:MAG: DUF805 domain-containing protein [Dehalococcoidia bacterium]|nr:DUF805 domain-containing protein [Dehalococcoidia bacterium]
MSFQQAVRSGLEKYARFEGRDGRSAFWFWVLFTVLVSIVAGVVDTILGTGDPSTGTGLVGGLASLALLVPSLAVGARRLHDIGKSGWMQLLAVVPILGWIYLIYLFAQEGHAGENQYGQPPVTAPSMA